MQGGEEVGVGTTPSWRTASNARRSPLHSSFHAPSYSRVVLGWEGLRDGTPRPWLRPSLPFSCRWEGEKRCTSQFPLWLFLCTHRPLSSTPDTLSAPGFGRWQGLTTARSPAWRQRNRLRLLALAVLCTAGSRSGKGKGQWTPTRSMPVLPLPAQPPSFSFWGRTEGKRGGGRAQETGRSSL